MSDFAEFHSSPSRSQGKTAKAKMRQSLKETVVDALSTCIRRADDVIRPKRSSSDFRQMRKLLFLSYSPALGTSVNGTPVFEAFKKQIPDCQIGVACSGLQYQVLRYSPYVDFIFKTRSPESNFIGALRDLRRALRESRFSPDCICTDARNARSRIVLLGFVGAYRRAGFAIRPGFLHRPVQINGELSVIDNNLNLLRPFGPDPKHLEPRVFFSAKEVDLASSLLGLTDLEGPPVAALITQGSGTQPTTWYNSRFAEVADYLQSELGVRVVFLGTEKDAPRIEAIRGAMRTSSLSAAGKTDVPGAAALLAMCDLGISIDTGTMHVARAVQLPMVLIASAWELPHTWLPWNQPQIEILRRNVISCHHCRKAVCKTRECLDEITVAHVKSAIARTLKRYPPSREQRIRRVSLSSRTIREARPSAN